MPPVAAGKKRARGLAAASSSKSKKAKKDTPEVEEEQGIENADETWADLKELWENAFDAFCGEDPASAAPLLRGLIFECDRIVRNSVDALHPLQTANAQPAAAQDGDEDEEAKHVSLESFYLIYGTSVYGLGQLIYLSSELALSSEPSPEAFFGKAIDFLLTATNANDEDRPLVERMQTAKEGGWKLQLARSRAVLGLLASASTSDGEGEDALDEESFAPLLAWATKTADGALAHIASLPLPAPPAEGQLPPPATRDPATSFLPSPPTSEQRLSLRHTLATSAASLVEALPPSVQEDCAAWCQTQLEAVKQGIAELKDVSDDERKAWEVKLYLSRGGVQLSLGSARAEQAIAAAEEDDGPADAAGLEAAEALLKSALADFTSARALRPRDAEDAPVAAQDGAEAEEKDEDELAALFVEACLTLIGLYESLGEDAGKEGDIAALEEKARGEGWEGYGSDGEEDDEDD